MPRAPIGPERYYALEALGVYTDEELDEFERRDTEPCPPPPAAEENEK